MKKTTAVRRPHIRGLLLLGAWLLIAWSCAGPWTVVQNVGPVRPELKKRIVILPFFNQAGFSRGVTAQITAEFTEIIRRDPDLILYDIPGKPLDFSRFVLGEPGVVDYQALLTLTDHLDIHALVVGILNPVELDTQKKGFWPFRAYKRIYDVSLALGVVDTLNGTLILSRLESEKVSFPLEEPLGQDERFVTEAILTEAVPSLIKRQSVALKKGLAQEPWTGKILSVDSGTLTINGGRDVGIRRGHRFEVYALGEGIQALGGKTFRLLGKKVGEIEVKSAMERRALAEPVKGDGFRERQIIRLK
jgi:hypothetical protein